MPGCAATVTMARHFWDWTMTRILAVDTTSAICSAALYDRGDVTAEQVLAPRRHTELLLPMVHRLLSRAQLQPGQLDAIAFGRGPGSFTGLRIALGVAQGMAFSCDLPMLAISSLATMAQSAMVASNEFCCALDARMGEIYWGHFQRSDLGIVTALGPERVMPPSAVITPTHQQWLALGPGWALEGMPAAPQLQLDCEPVAVAMLPLALHDWRTGQLVAAEDAVPVYLRDRIAISGRK